MAKKKKSRRKKKSAAAGPPTPSTSPASGGEDERASTSPGSGRRHTLICLALSIASGCAWFLATADFDIWPLGWVALVPLLWVIENAKTRKRAVLYAWLAGTITNVGGFYWITGLLTRFGHLPLPVALLGLVLLGAYQGTVFMLFALALRRIREFTTLRFDEPLPMVLLAPVVMVMFELLVPFIFPWYLAITQAWVPPVIQIAELTGPLGVSALLVMVSGAIYDVLIERKLRRRLVPAASAIALVAICLGFGFMRLASVDAARAAAPTIKIGVVQGNIPFDEKGINKPQLAAQQLHDLQAKSAELEKEGADLILWSESSYPYAISRDATTDLSEQSRARVRRGFSVPIIFGAVTYEPGNRDKAPYNTALMIESDGRIAARFDKIFLLIFGEYIPLVESFPWIRDMLPRNASHFSRGEGVTTFPFEHEGARYRLGPLICYEDILPSFGRRLAELRPHLLVNITNDAWFGDTSEPWEHLALSVYRAVEMRTDMVRAVNTGVSAFIDANGRVYAETYAVDPKVDPRGVDGIVAEATLMEGGHTFFARFGDLFGYTCTAAGIFLWLIWPFARRRRER